MGEGPPEKAAALSAAPKEDRYLLGLRVLVTRPADQAEETATEIERAGGTALCCPCLVLGPSPCPAELQAALREIRRNRAVALASVAGAEALLAGFLEAGEVPGEALSGVLVAAVGGRTAAALRAAGVRVDVVAGEGGAGGQATGEGRAATGGQGAGGQATGEDRAATGGQGSGQATGDGLAAALVERLGTLAGARVLLPRAKEGREALHEALVRAGAEVRAVAAYEMIAAPPERLLPAVAALRAGEIDLVPLGSPRTAAILMAALGADAASVLAHTLVGAIGPTTAEALLQAGIAVDVVADASFPALLRGLASSLVARSEAERRPWVARSEAERRGSKKEG